jgi:hypothetical protein
VSERLPPRLATWILMQVASDYRRDSFIGDLFEQFEHGKSRTWYCKQVFAAFGVASAERVRAALISGLALLRLMASACFPASMKYSSSTRMKAAIKRLLAALAVIALGTATLTWAGTTIPRAAHPPGTTACAEPH